MSSIFPIRDTVTPDADREPRLVDFDEETADDVFNALSSGTTREIFLSLHSAPQTASDLADTTDTSVQNIQYHLGKLSDADLIEVVDTWYSERGTEMKVYAPKDDSLVLFAGRDKQGTLRNLLNRVVGVFSLLLPVSLLAGLGARLTTSTEPGDGGSEITVGGDQSELGSDDASEPQSDGVDVQGTPEDARSIDTFDGGETVFVDNETAYIVDNETAVAVKNATLSSAEEYTSDDSVTVATSEEGFIVEGDLAEPGSSVTVSDGFEITEEDEIIFTVDDGATAVEDANITAVERDGELVSEFETEQLNESAVIVEGEIAEPGSNITVPAEFIEGTTDVSATIAGLDPALAVAAGVLVGGLTVAGGLAAWYGTGGWMGSSEEATEQ